MSAPRGCAIVGLALLAGCGAADSSGPAGERASTATLPSSQIAPRNTRCPRLRSRVTGRVAAAAATELSGLVMSRGQPDVLWTHNDSGDRTRVFAVAPDGRLLAEVAVTGAAHVDWEDIATGRSAGEGDALYIADIGDNKERRSGVVVYRAREPRIVGAGRSLTVSAQPLALRYPDGPHNAETLLVDSSSGALVIVTKVDRGSARVYVADHPSAVGTTTMRAAGTLPLRDGQQATGGSVSANGRTIVVRTYSRAFTWSRHGDESLVAAMRRPPCGARADLIAEGQGEALALTRDGRAFYTVPEGAHPALRRYTRAG
jgi:hypothetical protein